ncbi:MAG: hypothetical protein GXY36_15925 [Chloroflexi bacterium]|nr:hypothetical protein [Chloroflexota bacterium]
MHDEPHTPRRIRLKPDRFDRATIALALVLLAAITGVVLAGDRVGVAASGHTPVGVAGGADPIRVRFTSAMSPHSAAAHFRITPDVPGDLIWQDAHTLAFWPRTPLIPGETYTVTITAGAESVHGATLLDDFRWSFTVREPRVVYLAPPDALARNLYMADFDTGQTFQLTFDEYGIEDYAVSPNGRALAYTHANPDGTSDIWLLDLLDQSTRPLTNCVDALCNAPAWKPDSTQIAYQRAELGDGAGTGIGHSRAWIVDVATLATGLLFDDAQILGAEPVWSPDGSRVAAFDAALPGIRVRDLATGDETLIPTLQGITGRFSPDGQTLVYPVLVRGALGQEFYTHLEAVDLQTVERVQLSGPEDTPLEDSDAAWSPDGSRLAITRRYLDERFTPGRQIYLLDPATLEVEPLVVDAAYNHAVLSWDQTGTRLVFQRLRLGQAEAQPEVWIVDVASGDLTQVAAGAFSPRWVP